MNYCQQKPEFWPMLATTLHIIKKEISLEAGNTSLLNSADANINNGSTLDCIIDYFNIENKAFENEFPRFNEFILEANIKSVSFAFKIYSIQLFEMCYLQ